MCRSKLGLTAKCLWFGGLIVFMFPVNPRLNDFCNNLPVFYPLVRDGLFNPSQTFEFLRNVLFANMPKVYTPTRFGAEVLGINLNERA